MDIDAWLRGLGFDEYIAAFAENGVDGDLLRELSNDDLKDLGIARLADRKRLLKAIARLDEDTAEAEAGRPALKAADGERRQVTVLFADIAGYTAMSERRGAEEMHRLLNQYFEAVDRIIEEFGGTVDKHMGDGVMAVFGAPVTHDNDPERAARAALAMHEAAGAITPPGGGVLALHVGIASGQVVASGTGSDSHREYTVIGDSVNLAARLQGLAGPGETLISGSVQRQLAGRFATTRLGPRKLKGIERPVEVWRIDAALEPSGERRGTPFVGRRAELGQCRAILQEVVATGDGQTILLRGPAGIGKTRLAEEVARVARECGFSVHRSLVLDFGSRKGQAAVPALVRSLLGLPSSSTREERGRAADAALAAGAFAAADRVFVNDLLDLPQPLELRAFYNAMDDAARREGRRMLLASLVTWASRDMPQLVMVEDLHWADSATLDSLSAVMAAASDNRVALLGTTRPEGDPMETAWRTVALDRPISIINLGPLRLSEAREMAASFARANKDRLAECLERAAGNPLFLEQLLQSVIENATAASEVPGSIQSLVQARMDRLRPLDKRALQAASVFGQRFSSASLRHLLDAPDYDCTELLRQQLIRPEGEDYLFAHALIRDAVYGSILTGPRARLHLKAAGWFAGGDPALHAEHLELAGDERAPAAFLEAARAEMASYRYAAAIALLTRGKGLARVPADRVALSLALGEAELDTGEPVQARAAFEEALAAADEDAARCRALLGSAGVKRITEDLDGALTDLDAAQAIADRLGLVAEAARAGFIRGNLLFPRGDIEGCLREHTRALDLARQAGSAEMEAAALGGLGDAEYMRGHYHSASQRFTECVAVSRRHGFGRTEVANLPMIAITSFWCGPLDPALEAALAAVEAARRVGHGRAEMIAHHSAHVCYKPLGNLERAAHHARAATALAVQLGARRFEAESECFLADVEYLEGKAAEALHRVRRAVAIIREVGMAYMGPMILGVLAAMTDDPAEKRAVAAEAEAMLEKGSISHNHIFFRTRIIDASLGSGDQAEAERHARALKAYCAEPQMVALIFYAERGLALARVLRGERSAGLAAEIDRLVETGENLQHRTALPDLRKARQVMAA